MLIQCTKKLLDQMHRKPEPIVGEEQPLFSWHANLLMINRRKAVVLMHDTSRYPIVLYGLKKDDFNHLGTYITGVIRQIWSDVWMRPEVIQQYLGSTSHCIFTRTKNRKRVSQLTRTCDNVSIDMNKLASDRIIQSVVSRETANVFVGDGKGNYFYPSEVLYGQLEAMAGKPIFRCPAATMKVTLKLEKHKVWRRLIIPVDINFEKFHEILQAAFGWTNSHLHDFTVYEGGREVAHLVCNKASFNFPGNVPMFQETDRSLSEFVSPRTRMTYVYDFGDNWVHEITVEAFDADYPKNFPKCLAGEGATPPEDVGGEPGYEHYLEVMADPHHSEYEGMVAWSDDKYFVGFNKEGVNADLKEMLLKQ